MCKRIKGIHFPMMIVAGYCTSCLGQTLSPTCAVYGLLATEGNYMQDYFDRTLSQAETVYNPANIAMFLTLAILTMVIAVVTRPPITADLSFAANDAELEREREWMKTDRSNFAGKLNGSRIIMWLIGLCGIVVILHEFITKGFLGALSLNFIITFFLTVNCFLYSTPTAFIGAHKDCMKLGTEVMFQFPFYGGIAGIMSSSGLAALVVSGLVQISTVKTLPVVAYLSAAIVNLFIPSQGGQFIIQGPLLMDAAQHLGSNMITVVNGFVYGDQVTNLIQPLYIIPALAMTGTKLKHVWGFMAFICVFWLIITIIGLMVFPVIF
ncbi:MAG: short-chain fatty acid transporter [Clostridiales bacterium]|nr:short-chain fatty acid transporter [Clostridiales bacterium]